jgi:hypothetical protein
MRQMSPGLKLGIADDARFWSPLPNVKRQVDPSGKPVPPTMTRDEDMLRGLEDLRWLKEQGVKVDYFAIDGQNPSGVWADPQDIYGVLDAYAKEGVRIHITQFGVPVGARIEGPVRHDLWTPELRAQYYEEFFTVCFSHPAVDVINVHALGNRQWLEGEGLLDAKEQPTPALAAIRELIMHKWHTEATGRLDPAGTAGFRGFHGDYELTVTGPSGTAVAALSVMTGKQNHFRFILDGGKLTKTEDR